jgi:hypothetical protein
MNATRALLSEAVDYAGLFPPAQLDMVDAARNYAQYRRDSNAWALGRFVVPANRLDVLERAIDAMPVEEEPSWPLSVLAGPKLADDLERVRALDENRLRAESLEIRASSTEEIREIGSLIGNDFETYVELPLDTDVPRLVGALAHQGLRAKIRTGGVTADAFPPAEGVVGFIAACVEAGIPFKATAGLHHPLRGDYRLTYEINSATAPMYGYLNIFAATALLRSGGSVRDAVEVLLESDRGALRLDDAGVIWRDRLIPADALAAMRREAMVSFGSCSVREPLDELAEPNAG